MRVACFLVVLLAASLVSESDAWGRRLWRSVKNGARKAVDWAKDNCSVGTGGVSCNLGRKRALNEALSAEKQASLDATCQQMKDSGTAQFDGVPFTVVKDVFDAVDGAEGDDSLDEKEFPLFLESLEAFTYCLTKSKTQ